MAKKKEEEGQELSSEDARAAKLAEWMKAATKQYGDGSVVTAKDFTWLQVPRISTGIFPLDYGLGGGLPVGRMAMFYGHKSTSKSTILLRAVGNAQKCCSDCWTKIRLRDGKDKPFCECGKNRKTSVVWLDVEGVWDHEWAGRFLDLDSLILSQPATGEQAIDMTDSVLRSGVVDIVVIDSIAFLAAASEIDKSSAEPGMGVQARLVGGAMRKFVSAFNAVSLMDGRRPTVWVTNQIRNKIGVMFGSPETVPGGLAIGFATSCEIRTSGGTKYVMDEITGKPMSVELKYKVTKNKTGFANMEGEYVMVLSGDQDKHPGEISDEDWACDMAEKSGLIDVDGNTRTWHEVKIVGAKNMVKHFMKNKADYEMLRDELMPVLLAV